MSTWKKVVLRGDNVSTELLKATDAAVNVAADSIVFADDGDGSGVLKKDSIADFTTAIAGTAASSGLTASSGALKLNTGTDISSGLDAANDLIIVKDATDNTFKTATVTSISSAAASNTTYTLSVADTDDDTATINLVPSSGSNDTIAINVNVAPDGTGSSGELTINTSEVGASGAASTIDIGMNSAFTTVASILKSDLVVGRDAHNQIDFGTDNQISIKANNSANSTVVLDADAFFPSADSELDLGKSGTRWKHAYFDDLSVGTGVSFTDTSVTAANFTGLASSSTTVGTTNSSSATGYIAYVASNNTGQQGVLMDTDMSYNASTATLTVANITGTASNATNATNAGTATTANNVKLVSHESDASAHYFVFSEGTNGASNALFTDPSFSWQPSTETLTVTNLVVSGTTTTVNTTNLAIEDANIVLAQPATGSNAAGDASGAGVRVSIGSTEGDMPEVRWQNSGTILTGWSVSDYNDDGATDHAIAIMGSGSGDPSDTLAGAGSLYADSSGNNLWVYI